MTEDGAVIRHILSGMRVVEKMKMEAGFRVESPGVHPAGKYFRNVTVQPTL